MIITLDIIQAPTGRAKCYNNDCQKLIMKGKPKGVIEVEEDVDGAKVIQNRSLCIQCTTKNVVAMADHVNRMAMKINVST